MLTKFRSSRKFLLTLLIPGLYLIFCSLFAAQALPVPGKGVTLKSGSNNSDAKNAIQYEDCIPKITKPVPEATVELPRDSSIVTVENGLLSIDCRGSQIDAVFREIGRKAKLNILMDKAVKGKIDLFLSKVPLIQALYRIAVINGYSIREDGPFMMISTERKLDEISLFQSSRVFELKHITANEFQDILKNLFGSKLAIQTMKNGSRVAMKGSADFLDSMGKLLESADRPVPFHRVLFEIKAAAAGRQEPSLFQCSINSLDGEWVERKILLRGQQGVSLSFKVNVRTKAGTEGIRLVLTGDLELQAAPEGKARTGPVAATDHFATTLETPSGVAMELARLKLSSSAAPKSATGVAESILENANWPEADMEIVLTVTPITL